MRAGARKDKGKDDLSEATDSDSGVNEDQPEEGEDGSGPASKGI